MLRFLVLLVACSACTGELVGPRPALCGETPRLARLSDSQYRSVAARLVPEWAGVHQVELPFAQPRRADLFSTWSQQASLDAYDVDDAWRAADALATEWTSRNAEACLTAAPTLECGQRAFTSMLTLLWSRPPTQDEVDAVAEAWLQARAELSPSAAAQSIARELLLSPQFLFRSELGVEGRLTGPELAAALSFTLREEAPSEELVRRWSAASPTVDEVGTEARQLLTQPAQLASLRRFLREYLRFPAAADVRKTATGHQPAELIDDTERVVEQLLETHARSGLHRALLTSDLIYVRPSTAPSWGIAPVDAGTFLHEPTRTGVLTHPAWLVAHSLAEDNHLVRRGLFIREQLLCDEVPSLPGGVVPEVARTAGLTFRQRVERHSTDPACAGCHTLMDPLGYAFEGWDHLGRPQLFDNGSPVNTAGRLEGAGEVDGAYTDARELLTRLADSKRARACFIKQLYRSFRGRDVRAADRCELERLTALYESSGEDTLAVLEAMFASEAFVTRTEVVP